MAETILNVAAEKIPGKLISLATNLISLALSFKEHIEEVMHVSRLAFLTFEKEGPFLDWKFTYEEWRTIV